ncbi:F-box protein [Escovopsis weberi]|uniref:F-box protein n=1 Tax=Escovopsis weberi TaxID=150374 RepID=A0A0M8N2U8_ESCWE|nr:F-box protein [Escovopsis weberi]
MTQVNSIPTHPLGLKPLGNQYFTRAPIARRCTGSWGALPDEILSVVLDHFGTDDLLRLGSTCKFFYAFCHSDELWKSLYLRYSPQVLSPRALSQGPPEVPTPERKEAKVDCSQVFSDVLHRPFACSNIALSDYAGDIPKANQISRFENLTYDEYAEKWTETPFVLTKCIQDWPVCSRWTIDSLLRDYADVEFRAEAVDWTFARYCDYMNTSRDESPLYLFDRKFAEKMSIEVGRGPDASYWRPECFGPDLFEVLGGERPAHRWLIIGPERSGSTFHKDPNGTSAWNAVVQGSKYWIMFPPEAEVPGVYVSQDSSEVTSPLSIAEWLLTFHGEARRLPSCVEGVCAAGEMLHVPSGWWHLVVNLESGIALTQNFVPQSPSLSLLCEVLAFLRDKPDQVSGFPRHVENPFELFSERLGQGYPSLLQRGLELADRKAGKKRKWDVAVGRDEEGQQGAGPDAAFSFGFGDLDDLEEEEEEET